MDSLAASCSQLGLAFPETHSIIIFGKVIAEWDYTGPLSKRDGPTALRSHPKEVLPQAIAPHCMLCSVHADIRFCTLITLSGNSYWASPLFLSEKLPRLKKSCFKPKNVQAYQDQIFRAKINVK